MPDAIIHAPVITYPSQPLHLEGRSTAEMCEVYLDCCHQLRQMKLDFFGSCWCSGCEIGYKSAKADLEKRIKELHAVLYPIFKAQAGTDQGQTVDRRKADKAAA